MILFTIIFLFLQNQPEWKTTKTNYVFRGDNKQYHDKELLQFLFFFVICSIFSGSGHPQLAESICQYLGVPLQSATVKQLL